MELTDRQTEILDTARTQGRVSVEGLAASFEVTPQTIRRDLNDLCTRGLLSRIHGGAIPSTSVSNVGYEHRRQLELDAKQRIGARAADLLPQNCSVILNLGTTTEQVARHIYNHRDLVVITNNINVVNILSGSPQKELILAGGAVRQTDGGIIGEAAVDFMRGFKVDYAFIGASALDTEGAILDFDYREVSVAREIVRNARKVILVSDVTKFDRTAPVRICGLGDIDFVVTDAPPPPDFVAACAAANVEIVVAEEVPDHG